MGSDTLMKTCYVLPLLPSFPSATERRRCNEENKGLGWDEERKKDRRRIRASAVLLQNGEKNGKDGIDTGSHLML